MTPTSRTLLLIPGALTACCLPMLGGGATCSATNAPPPPPGREAVVLLHGLARTVRSMRPMAQALTDAGYAVYPLSYPSTEKTVQQLADDNLAPLLDACRTPRYARIHFVAHSLGGIVLRQYFATHSLTNAGRIVMLGPPNQGSEVVDKLGRFMRDRETIALTLSFLKNGRFAANVPATAEGHAPANAPSPASPNP